jgi:hypothetical protein
VRPSVLPVLLLGVLCSGPALAKVLAEGEARGGFYWQKIETSKGAVRYLCRSKADAKIQKSEKCSNAGSVKPQ